MAVATRVCGSCGGANLATATTCVHCNHSLPAIGAGAPGGAIRAAPTGAAGDPSAVLNHHTGLLAPNRVLHGRYRIVNTAGKGGMGAVYRARDERAGGRIVAVKELSQTGLDPAELDAAVATFHHEAALLASLKHASLPKIYDHFADGGRWYLVMDYIEGETLEQRLHRAGGRPLPVEEVLKIGERLCSVLTYLHSRRPPIIFRDLKPSNVMMAPKGQLYLIDFGIARIFKPGQRSDTVSLGSPGYAAPEQYGKAQTTVRSDIYSLGATLHQLLTGIDPSVRPFEFVPIRGRNPLVPPELDALINRMVQMNDRLRPETTAIVERDLKTIDARMHMPRLQAWTRTASPTPSAAAKPARAKTRARGASARNQPAFAQAAPNILAQPVQVPHVQTPPPPRTEMRRSKRSVLALALASITLFIVSLVESVNGLTGLFNWAQGSAASGGHIFGPLSIGALALIVGLCLWFVAWVISMVRTALVARWGWFTAMLVLGIFLGPFAVAWYGLFGPLERRV